MATAVTVKGLDKLIEKLERLGKADALKRPMTQAVQHLHDTIAEYPPSGIANSPMNGYSWYERGFGTRTRTGRAWNTSETLGRRWTEEVSANGQRGVVGNNASYAEYVQSAEKQAGFHAMRGWKTDEQVTREEAGVVVEFFNDAIARLLD